MIQRRFAFFGRVVVVETDSPEVADTLDLVYERQQLNDSGASAEWDVRTGRATSDMDAQGGEPVRVRVLSNASEAPRVLVGRRTVRVPDASQLVHYAHLILVNVAASEAEDRTVLHSGSVRAEAGVVLLVGSSGWGKTTLTMELVRRGWGFLSDDFAVLRPDGVVEGFPRRVNLTAESVALLGLNTPESELRLEGFGRQAKWMVDVDCLFPGSISDSARLDAVFVLSPGAGTVHAATGGDSRPDQDWRLEFDHLPPGFATRLRSLPGVETVSVIAGTAPAVVNIRVGSESRIVPDLDELCATEDVTVLSALRGATARPDFRGPARAERVDVVDALPVVLSHSLSLSGRRFLHGTETRDVMSALARLRRALESSGAAVYRLTPGDLTETADLVQRISREPDE